MIVLDLQKNLEKRFHSVFESAVDGIIIINARGIILNVNTAATNLFGYSREELIDTSVNKLMPFAHSREHDQYISSYLETRKPKIIGIGREVEGVKKNGDKFPFWLSVNEISIEGGSLFTGFIHDLTDMKKVEHELVQLNQDLENKVIQRTYDLEKVVNQLLQLNKKHEDEISARKFTEEQLKIRESELKKSLEKEKELGELKSRFVSMASHEFRTPLATIASSASLILKYVTEETQANREKHIEKIKSSVTHLTNILNDFLSISRLEEGKAEARLIPFNMEEAVLDFFEEIQPLFTKNKIFSPKISLSDPMVETDPNIFKNVLFNLVSNAIKYTKVNGEVQVIVEDTDSHIKLTVKDNGIGIPQSDQKHLFDRFFRAGNATNIEGTGLGLFIVKKYTEILHGDITFTSIEGEGTSFFVTIPKKPNIHQIQNQELYERTDHHSRD